MCPSCGISLAISRYLDGVDGIRYKSCPQCSRRHERHAYWPLEVFGERTMATGEVIDQSWCSTCRGNGIANNPPMFC